ncbi:MAG: HdeD family acid-resistance protein [Mariniblastus sp.]|jgi:uncharacterized membrane protein HdeD (DUF308 family)
MSEANNPFQEFCTNAWFLILLRGIGLVVLGGLFIFKPGIVGIVLVQFLGAYFIVDGLFSTAKAVLGRKYMPGWGCGLIMGLLEIVTGAFVFAHPLAGAVITVKVLAYLVAFMAISFGALGIYTGLQVRKELNGEWAMIVGGCLALIVGLILIMDPLGTAKVYVMVLGGLSLLGGVIQIFAAFQIRRIGKVGLEAVIDESR